MKNLLLIVGIVSLIGSALAMWFSVMNRFIYNGLMDGRSEVYVTLHQRMMVSGVIGIILAVIGAVCMILRFMK